jgi:hypothetical protein
MAMFVVVVIGVPLLAFLAIGLFFTPGSARLEPGEEIVSSHRPSGPDMWASYVFTLGIFAFWRAANQLVITNRRVVHLEGLVRKHERSLPLHFIQDVSLKSVLWSGRIIFSTAGGLAGLESFGPLWTEEARAIKDTITDRARRSLKAPASVDANNDTVAKLKALQELHDSGTLSSDEFALAKGRVLQEQPA